MTKIRLTNGRITNKMILRINIILLRMDKQECCRYGKMAVFLLLRFYRGVPHMTKMLHELLPGETGVIAKVSGSSAVHRRIIEMGVVPGTLVKIVKYAPLGDPIEIKVKGFNLSLRKSEAAMVQVETA